MAILKTWLSQYQDEARALSDAREKEILKTYHQVQRKVQGPVQIYYGQPVKKLSRAEKALKKKKDQAHLHYSTINTRIKTIEKKKESLALIDKAKGLRPNRASEYIPIPTYYVTTAEASATDWLSRNPKPKRKRRRK